jgi:hypothetical protein
MTVNKQSDVYLTQPTILQAISDGGTTAHIMSLKSAKILLEASIISEIVSVQPGTMSIIFGKTEATEPVIGEIYTHGILGKILVVDNIATTLISETALTALGVIFLKNDRHLIGLYKDSVVVRG